MKSTSRLIALTILGTGALFAAGCKCASCCSAPKETAKPGTAATTSTPAKPAKKA